MTTTTPTTTKKDGIILLNAEADALTVSWPEVDGAVRYVLQYRPSRDNENDDGDDDGAFETLSENLKSTQVRKKNLSNANGNGFVFRVGPVLKDQEQPFQWITSSSSSEEPFRLLTADAAAARMEPPKVVSGGSSFSGIVSWKKKSPTTTTTTKYELQMRENVGGAPWECIAASLSNTEVKKKNLTSSHGYQFRVRPAGGGGDDDNEEAFSAPSEVFVGMGLSPGLKRLFASLEKGTLLRNVKDAPPVTLEEALGGKEFILLYASAHWCGPCRNFTPMLSQWYQSLGVNKPVEVVFLSADHDANGFRNYFTSMPWLTIDFDEDSREELMSFIRVTGIPRLCVIDGATGRIIEDNAVGKPLDINRWRQLRGGGK